MFAINMPRGSKQKIMSGEEGVKKSKSRVSDDESSGDLSERGVDPEISESDGEGLMSSGGESRSGSESDSSIADSDMEVEVEFEARAIEECDYHGIRRLLQQLYLKANVDLCALTNIIITQGQQLGSTVKISSGNEVERGGSCLSDGGMVSNAGEGVALSASCDQEDSGDEVYGIATMVRLDQRACCRQIRSHLVSRCPGDILQLEQLLGDEGKTCLLLKERFLNIPADIVPLLMRCLLKEWAELECGACEHVVLLTRSHVVGVAVPGRKRKKCLDVQYRDDVVLDFQEDQIFLEVAEQTFSYAVSEECDQVFGGKWCLGDDGLKPSRTVMVLSWGKLQAAIQTLEQMLSQRT